MIYTVQAVSSTDEEKIVQAARMLEFSEKGGVRVEKVNGLYTLRVGRYAKNEEAIACLGRVKKTYPGAFLRRAYDIPKRSVYTGNAFPETPEDAAPLPPPGKTAVVQESVGSEKIKSESGPLNAGSETAPVFTEVVHDGGGSPIGEATVEIRGIPHRMIALSSVLSQDLPRPEAASPATSIPLQSQQTLSSPEPIPTKSEFSPGPGSPPSDPVTIDADSISYNRDDDTYHAQGQVVMTYSGGILTADSVVLNKAEDDALAEGNVVVTSGKDVLEGERIMVNIATKMGVAYQGKAFISQNHFYLTGKKIEKKGEATYHIQDATATTCDGDSPDWQLKGSVLDITLDGYGTLKDARLLAKNIPVLYTPYLLFPAKTTRQSGFLYPHITYSGNKNGWDGEVPFYWAISKSSDATFYQRYMDKRGFKEGVEFRYSIDKDSFGTFYGDYMNDSGHFSGPTGNLNRNWTEDQKRWSFYLNHETTFSATSYIRTDIMKVSDPWYFRDFDSYNYYLDNYSKEERKFRKIAFLGDGSLGAADSTVRFVKNWPLYNLTGLVKYSEDFNSVTNDATLQRYPEITFTGIKRPLMGSAYNLEFAGTYDYFYRVRGQKGHFADIQPVLSRPVNLGVYLQMTPQVAVRETVWSRDDKEPGDNRQSDRHLYTLGLNLNTEVHRIFNIGGPALDKIRHGIKPELTYTYVPYVNQLDMPNYVAAVGEQNTLTYALTNTLIARLKEKGGTASYREFLRLKLFQTYDIKEARRGEVTPGPERRPFSDVNMELDFLPFSYLSFSARHAYSVNSGYWRQTNYDLSMSDARGDAATIGYRYTKFSLEEVNLALKAVLTPSLALSYVLRRNELDHITMERTYGMKYRKQCWTAEITYSERASSAQATDQIYMVMVTLYGLGQVGQEVWKSTASTTGLE